MTTDMSNWKWIPSYPDDDYDGIREPETVKLSKEEEAWLDILYLSRGNPGLADLVEKCKMYHILMASG